MQINLTLQWSKYFVFFLCKSQANPSSYFEVCMATHCCNKRKTYSGGQARAWVAQMSNWPWTLCYLWHHFIIGHSNKSGADRHFGRARANCVYNQGSIKFILNFFPNQKSDTGNLGSMLDFRILHWAFTLPITNVYSSCSCPCCPWRVLCSGRQTWALVIRSLAQSR